MEENELQILVETINDVNNHIWLGDFKSAKKISELIISELRDQYHISQYEDSANKWKRILRSIQKKAREKAVKKVQRRFWVGDTFSEIKKEQQLDSMNNLYGVLTIHLLHLKEAVSYLVEAQYQKTLETKEEKPETSRLNRIDNRYSYSIQHLPDLWEVRALLDSPKKTWNTEAISQQLVKYDFIIEKTINKPYSNIFELYSKEMYIHAYGGERRIVIVVRAPLTEDVDQRIDQTVRQLLDAISSDSK